MAMEKDGLLHEFICYDGGQPERRGASSVIARLDKINLNPQDDMNLNESTSNAKNLGKHVKPKPHRQKQKV